MGLLDAFKGKTVTASELRGNVIKAMDVLVQMHQALASMPAPLSEAAIVSYIQRVGEHPEETMARLVKVERGLLQGDITDIPRHELTELREVMHRLKVHLLRSYSESRRLPQGAQGRRVVQQVAKERNTILTDLIKTLDRALR
ncbi:MAG: hypothetical protein LUQ09_01565 [Methanomassiliicoccales archaeon]|nr:hypothetical protein [Methanomassiliicoccales archaeon]